MVEFEEVPQILACGTRSRLSLFGRVLIAAALTDVRFWPIADAPMSASDLKADTQPLPVAVLSIGRFVRAASVARVRHDRVVGAGACAASLRQRSRPAPQSFRCQRGSCATGARRARRA